MTKYKTAPKKGKLRKITSDKRMLVVKAMIKPPIKVNGARAKGRKPINTSCSMTATSLVVRVISDEIPKNSVSSKVMRLTLLNIRFLRSHENNIDVLAEK